MQVGLIERLNVLWRPIYPYLAEWVCRLYEKEQGWMLELGPFSGGISDAVLDRLEGMKTMCVTPEKAVITGIRVQFREGINCVAGAMDRLPFPDGSFDMVISRGAFFFLTPEILQDVYRVLRSGALALLGGGYGPLTPEGEIRKIARESKELNYRLGKKWIGREKLEELISDSGIGTGWEIIEEGGLWLLLRRN
ncbi:MAG: class I SAM-dependent methyltransferase [Deltaproteobacteria bacterium]|nr:class I SAM-dependent methyltransferase [Deltaproteobacteria bacterium]